MDEINEDMSKEAILTIKRDLESESYLPIVSRRQEIKESEEKIYKLEKLLDESSGDPFLSDVLGIESTIDREKEKIREKEAEILDLVFPRPKYEPHLSRENMPKEHIEAIKRQLE